MIITSICAFVTYLIFSALHLFVPTIFFSRHCHYTYLTSHIFSHIYAPILLIFVPFPKKNQAALVASKHPKRTGRDVHIIRIEQVQTGSDHFRPVKHSRSATERNRDLTETFLSL